MEQTRLLYANSPMPIMVSVLAALLLTVSLRSVIEPVVLIAWFATLFIVSMLRLWLLFLFKKSDSSDRARPIWHARFLAGTCSTAVVWGASAFLIFPEQSLAHQIVYFMIMVGMAAGGISSLCPSLTVLIGFLSLILLPLILQLLLLGTGEGTMQAALVFLFWLVTVVGGEKINRNIQENIELRLESYDREQVLKANEKRYRHIFDNAPLGIFQFDATGTIIDCNQEFIRILGSTRERLIGFNMLESVTNRDLLAAAKASLATGEGYFEGDYTSVTGSKTTPVRIFLKTISHEQDQVVGGIGIVEDFTEKRKSEELIEYHASYDALTGLPNRRLFLDYLNGEISRARRHGYYGALLFLDIDAFKNINDSLGHTVGDDYLKLIAERLNDFTRKEDVASRMGGDEFTVVITELGQSRASAASRARKIAEKLSNHLASPSQLDGRTLQSTVSIGISMFPKDDTSVDDILKQADTAMYRAKAAGRNEICFFLPSMQEAADEKLHVSTELRQALQRNELHICVQPQVDIQGTLLGGEVLIRWRHAERGLVPPETFLGIAEETGLMQDIGRWVLVETCRTVREWQERSLLKKSQIISVNISGNEIAAPDFADTVRSVLDETGADPHNIGIELTEGSLVSTGRDIVEKIMRVRQFGIKFAVDDFGTGYSSLSYLKSLPLNTIKIDRSFVNDIEYGNQNVVLVDTIIMMAKNLGLEVIAEGVETEEELIYLSKKGCSMYQGFFFSKPVSVEAFEKILEKGVVPPAVPIISN